MAAKIFVNVGRIASLAFRLRTPLVNHISQPVCANLTNSVRWYAKKGNRRRSDCRLAKSDLPPIVDLDCPVPCEQQRKKRLGVLHWLKLKVVEGGTNFGS